MCGSTGLFIGCTALTSCPLNTLLEAGRTATDGTASDLPDSSYRSPFLHWDRQASVRKRPRRKLESDLASQYFPPELVPISALPEVRALAPEAYSRLLLRHLYQYLRFTIVLESQYVNPVALALYENSWGLPLPEAMRVDALAIYTDEAYHAMFSGDLLRQAETRSGVRHRWESPPAFAGRLTELAARCGSNATRALLPLLFTIVSETLISASLSEIPQRSSVDAGIREAVRDHAMDEGRHYSYFASVLRRLWPTLQRAHRVELGLLVPDLIGIFLDPDTSALQADLMEAGFSDSEAYRLRHLVDTSALARAQYAAIANSSVRAFQSAGALDDPQVREAFEAAGLLQPVLTASSASGARTDANQRR